MTFYKTMILFSVVLCCQGCFFDSNGDEACHQISEDEVTCSSYNHLLERCHSEGGQQNFPGCDVVEYCTDYSIDSDSDSVESRRDTESDSDIVPQGRICEQFCEGELESCAGMAETECRRAYQCEWMTDPVTI